MNSGKLETHLFDLDEYERLLVDQERACLICRRMGTNRLAIDHDHATGFHRGLLCRRCNYVLGLVNDDINLLLRMAAYVRAWDNEPCLRLECQKPRFGSWRLPPLWGNKDHDGATNEEIETVEHDWIEETVAFLEKIGKPMRAREIRRRMRKNAKIVYRALKEAIATGRLQKSFIGKCVFYGLPRPEGALEDLQPS
jgi:hypothetical protein